VHVIRIVREAEGRGDEVVEGWYIHPTNDGFMYTAPRPAPFPPATAGPHVLRKK
jgi:hypothetical protein